jgi:predicted S18 family serine protease
MDNSDGADIITPNGTSGNATTTKSPVTSSPITNNTTTAPNSSMTETEDGRDIAIWGIVLAVIIAGAVIAIIYLTVSKKR